MEYQDKGGSKSVTTLYVRAGKNSKMYYVVKTHNNRTVRSKIGEFGLLSIEQARDKAKKFTAAIVEGKDPNAEKKAKRQRGLNIGEIIEAYVVEAQARASKPLRDSTAANC